MAAFVKDTEINLLLEDLIREAEELLVLFCPYFKLHDRLRDCLRLRQNDPRLRIIVVFGKNEEDPSKSLNREDYAFLKSFPHVDVAYEKRLHAKYYANEKQGLITSLNLHAHSHNNNIEAGVVFQTKGLFKKLTDRTLGEITSLLSDTEDLATEAADFFIDVYRNAEKIFSKEPRFESTFLGLQKKYTHSEVIYDHSEEWYKSHEKENKPQEKSNIGFQINKQQAIEIGFCIRSGEKIAFNPARPLSRSSYQIWAEYSNPDYRERYCHSCGKSHSTSVRRPLCNECN